MKLFENFHKTDEILLEAQFCENQTKTLQKTLRLSVIEMS